MRALMRLIKFARPRRKWSTVVVGVVAEQDRPCLHDVHLVLDKPLLVWNISCTSHSVPSSLTNQSQRRVWVLLAGQPNDLGSLGLTPSS